MDKLTKIALPPPLTILGEIYIFPKRVGSVWYDGSRPFPNSSLNNWILLDAEIVNNQKIKLKVKALDTGDETNTWITVKRRDNLTVDNITSCLQTILKFKGRVLEEIKNSFVKSLTN